MLSEDAIAKLIQPLIDRQEKLNSFVINTIARRIKEIGNLFGYRGSRPWQKIRSMYG